MKSSLELSIGFDARMICHSGIGTYIRHLLRRLAPQKNLHLTLWGPLDQLADFNAKKISLNIPIYSMREQLFLPQILKREKLDVMHVPHYNAPLGYQGNLIMTVHDLIHLRFPPSRLAYLYARTMLEASCRKARKIIAVSEHTKKDIVQILKVKESKVHVVYSGFGIEWERKTTQNPNPEPYILYVGNIKPTKNLKVLLDAYLLAKKNLEGCKLVIAGKNFMPQWTQTYKQERDIQWLGEIQPNRLHELYRNAKIFVFPSLYEGFGFPPLEAMAWGVPVLSSSASSLPEVVGNAGLLFDPRDTNGLAKLLIDLWDHPDQRENLVRLGYENLKRFSWEKCAEETKKVYEECC